MTSYDSYILWQELKTEYESPDDLSSTIFAGANSQNSYIPTSISQQVFQSKKGSSLVMLYKCNDLDANQHGAFSSGGFLSYTPGFMQNQAPYNMGGGISFGPFQVLLY